MFFNYRFESTKSSCFYNKQYVIIYEVQKGTCLVLNIGKRFLENGTHQKINTEVYCL